MFKKPKVAALGGVLLTVLSQSAKKSRRAEGGRDRERQKVRERERVREARDDEREVMNVSCGERRGSRHPGIERKASRIDWESTNSIQRIGAREGASASKGVRLQVREHAFVLRRAPWPP